jgi:hypothetical protein
MRPVLKPALLRLWRDSSTVQLGIEPRHAVVLDGVSDAASAVLDLLDGSRDWSAVVTAAAAQGCDPADAAALLDLLHTYGALDDASDALSPIPVTELERLEPDRAHASLLCADPGGGSSTLLRRRAARVVVVGAGRVGSSAAALLCAAGVGEVVVCDATPGRASDASPAGYPVPEGRPRAAASAAAAQRCGAGLVRAWRLPVDDPALYDDATAVLLAPDVYCGPAPGLHATLLATRVTYLVAGVRETRGLVGPLVLPGVTSCARCADLFRADRDPGWPVIAAQLSAGRPGAVPSCDVVLATAVASVAAGQLLDHVDGRPVSALGATLEIPLPEWQLLRRSWRIHPACGCTGTAAC